MTLLDLADHDNVRVVGRARKRRLCDQPSIDITTYRTPHAAAAQAEVERLAGELEAHLEYEERELVPLLGG
ncbi:hypothetical protein [Streptomyces sp. L2]|uniref:hypothetical protein n=1 Tax=Streptomyces sp. L2 TaxID=2162665 RepID=UPI001F5068F2|nr:hypothetical protein [Streptomyces sp. L2]